MSSLVDTSDSSSEDEGDDVENDENYGILEAFDKLFLQSVDLENKNKQLKREIKELTLKSNSLEDTILIIQQESSKESEKKKDLSKENFLLLNAKKEMN